jgi:hypothetical protein
MVVMHDFAGREVKARSLHAKWKQPNLNSDQISAAAPSGKKFLDARTKEVTVSKCCFLTFQPSGPMFLKQT